MKGVGLAGVRITYKHYFVGSHLRCVASYLVWGRCVLFQFFIYIIYKKLCLVEK